MGKTLKQLLETFPFQTGFNPRNDGPGSITPDPTNQNAVELKQVKNYIKSIPKIYGTDVVRITSETDPHETKKAIRNAGKSVAGKLLGTGTLGNIAAGVTSLATDFNPKFPDDFLEGTEEDKNLSFYRYKDLYASNYAYGKYYNGGVKNSKSVIGKFLQSNKTPGQMKDAALGAAKTLIVGAAIAGATALGKKLFGKKKKKQGKETVNPAKPDQNKPPYPLFPSTFVMNSNPNDNEIVAIDQEQQMRDGAWPTRLANQGTIIDITTVSKIKGTASNINRTDDWGKLDEIYSRQIEKFVRKNNDTDSLEAYDVNSYYTSLTVNGGFEDEYKRIGKYSKDVLRIFTPSDTSATGQITPASWERYGSIKEFENNNPNWTNLIPTGSLLKFGTQNVSSLELGGQINETSASLDNWVSYWSANGIDYSKYWIKPVRYNGSNKPYSKEYNGGHNTILDQDYYFASSSLQSQNYEVNKAGGSTLNPYLQQRRDVLDPFNKDKYDRIHFKIGKVILMATLTGINDNTTPSWTDVKAVGSGFKFYLFDSWEREISFKFQMYAESQLDLENIYNKANQIKSYTKPTAKSNLGVFGQLISLKIGDMINIPHGFLTACNLTVVDESPWEITEGLQKPLIYEMDITYKMVTNNGFFPHYPSQQSGKKAFEIATKPKTATPVVIGPPPFIQNDVPDSDPTLPPLDTTPVKTFGPKLPENPSTNIDGTPSATPIINGTQVNESNGIPGQKTYKVGGVEVTEDQFKAILKKNNVTWKAGGGE
jgi:hypothetical protein